MPTIQQIISDIIKREGGYVDHPKDKGGPTKYGITLRTLKKFSGEKITKNDVENLTEDKAREIYMHDYVYSPGLSQLPKFIQPFVIDSAVNHGPTTAIKFVQNVCNELMGSELIVDGIVGQKTILTAQKCVMKFDNAFKKQLIEERRNYYKLIVERDEGQKVFFNGWMNRLKEFEIELEGI